MHERLFSEHWHRVAELKPRLRNHVGVHRHDYRGEVWYIIHDPVSGKSHRLPAAAWLAIALLDGRRTVEEAWRAACDRLGDDSPTQDELVHLLSQLHAADLLVGDVAPDGQELFRRHRRHAFQQLKQRLWSPLAVRVPLWDPDRFVGRTLWLVSPLIGWLGVAIWLPVVIAGTTAAALNWPELTASLDERVLTASNLFLIWLIYPVIKGVHELGHAYAVKKWGGEIHELGVMFIVFMPVPYVDASAATAFRRKGRRMIVGAMGVLVEVFLACAAALVWAAAEPGLVRAVAYNVMLIGGVSSILFNGNPLLRFDGYYVLADWAEIPNLATRANKHIAHLFQRYVFGLEESTSPASAPGERIWFVLYGVASFCYRMIIMFAIILFVATKFFFIGVMLAFWAVFTQILVPVGKMARFVLFEPRVGRHRRRVVLSTAAMLAAGATVLLWLPIPWASQAQGVLRPPEHSVVKAGTGGFAAELLAEPGSWVAEGQPLLRAKDPLLSAQVRVLEAKLAEFEARLAPVLVNDPQRANLVREQIRAAEADLADARRRLAALVIRSPAEGVLIIPRGQDILGRWLAQGTVVAFVLDARRLHARVVVEQDEIGLVRERGLGVSVWPADYTADVPLPATLDREVPGGTRVLPNPALGTRGGGPVAVDPTDSDGVHTLNRVFEIEISFDNPWDEVTVGRRVYVRFDHGLAPLGFQLWHTLRQVFLRRLDV